MKRIEEHQEETITDIESAKEYFNSVIKKVKLYGNLIKQIKLLNVNGRYLELGSGPCILTALLAESIPGIHITAVDISNHMTEIARKYIKDKNLDDKISVITGDPTDESMLKKLGKFDLVYSSYSMHHWKETEKIIHNIYNVVNMNGILAIADLRRIWWLYYLPIDDNWFISSIRASYTLSEVKSILKKLNIEKYKVKNIFPLSRLFFIYK
jgi:ubiquinone/menaquinone biosynthesis C-methylase UbiE